MYKKIILAITGSIAAYKAVELARLFMKTDCTVKVIMTKQAMKFITPLTFEAITRQPVYSDLFSSDSIGSMEHIDLAKWADAIVIAPASASIIAQLAHGLADDLLTTLCLATISPIYIAPAMNQQMWENTATQHNVKQLKSRGYRFIGPGEGVQACGDIGFGRLLEPADIFNAVQDRAQLFNNTNVLITAGPTQEAIDPVRYISNHSSGKMGYALAEAFVQQGANVTLLTGPTTISKPPVQHIVEIHSAEEMYNAVMQYVASADIFVSAAAIADYAPVKIEKHKIKKQDDTLELKLKKTKDILSAVGHLENKPFVVGFSAETNDLLKNANTKLVEKNADLIIANQISPEKNPFYSDENEVVILKRDADPIFLPCSSKIMIAREIIKIIYAIKLARKNFPKCSLC